MSISTNNINNTNGQESHTQSTNLLKGLSKDTIRPLSPIRLNTFSQVSSLSDLANTSFSNTTRTLSLNSLSRVSSSSNITTIPLSLNSLSHSSSSRELSSNIIHLDYCRLKIERTERPCLVLFPPTCNIKTEGKFAFDLNSTYRTVKT